MTSTPTPEPERQWVCHNPGWMGACSPQSTHHNGFDWGCGWIYFPAPTTPGEGTGRPLPEFQMVACADHMLTGHRWRCRACRREVERQFQECCEEMWRLQRTTPAPPASPVPPTPTPCPYIVTGGEGTSYCSLAERSAMHAAVPPTPTPQADGTGQALKSMAIELAVERRRASLATVALLNACRDGWADGDSAAAKYLAEAELAAAPPSTPADPHPTDPTGSEA